MKQKPNKAKNDGYDRFVEECMNQIVGMETCRKLVKGNFKEEMKPPDELGLSEGGSEQIEVHIGGLMCSIMRKMEGQGCLSAEELLLSLAVFSHLLREDRYPENTITEAYEGVLNAILNL